LTVLTVDTNILLRYALNDHPALSARAKEIIEGNTCFAPLLAVAEMGFVLSSVFEASPKQVVAYLKLLMQQRNIRFENESRLLQALAGVDAGVDWFDALLWASSPVQNEFATLDRQFAKKAAKLGWQPPVVCQL
jgi:predicted nucleic acid-binding protein